MCYICLWHQGYYFRNVPLVLDAHLSCITFVVSRELVRPVPDVDCFRAHTWDTLRRAAVTAPVSTTSRSPEGLCTALTERIIIN